MISALKKLGIRGLTDNEINLVLDSMDLDSSGSIDYKEFERKL
jgi:Ca2+-binding EF-hand superfamily protein